MNRRQFIGRALAVAGAVVGGWLITRLAGRTSGGSQAYGWAPDLFDEKFAGYVVDNELSEAGLHDALVAKQVLSSEGDLDRARLRQLAREDAVLAYGDFFFTESELQLYALAFLRKRRLR